MKNLTQEDIAEYLRITPQSVSKWERGDYDSAEKTYRDALLIYPNKPGMILGLASTLALKGNTDEAIELMEKC